MATEPDTGTEAPTVSDGPTTTTTPSRRDRRTTRDDQRSRWIAIAVTIAAVIVVHGTSVRFRLFYDDYGWLERKPGNVGDVLQWFVPDEGVYRPLEAAWFQLMRIPFGVHPLPYHLFALAVVVAMALAVRWMALELGLRNVPATVAGIVVGTHAALATSVFWVSDIITPAAVAFAASAIAVSARSSRPKSQVVAGVLLLLALMFRESPIVVPVVATLLLAARDDVTARWRSALHSTIGLWVVAVGFGLVRLAAGSTRAKSDAPYRLTFGHHVISNLRNLVKFTANFGIYEWRGSAELQFARFWYLIFWAVLFGLALWALTRRSYLPAAGIVAYTIGLLPFLGIANKGMAPYYVEIGLLGLAVAIGALVQTFSVRLGAVIAGVVVFVVVQIVFVHTFQSRSILRTVLYRNDVMEEYSDRTPTVDGVLVVKGACPGDEKWTKRGALFRVLRDEPDLEVRFEVTGKGGRADCTWPPG